ncbi:MAG: TetR/AcrR family transcriptional regulator [Chitinophagales bacterium]|nr:TetR family transcriptional regulator [Chitinophagales bacterium]MCO5281149.1 TetR/AcrR family transcriptional regulator [Chitinophagales bacterium]OJV30818.1 MAG: hypothetical protein BGO32_10000 [Bacteroidetes bacterium 37-13]HRN93610.1 TetR/AcrR family transcriptional regulator [Chitinophagales bacterium]HRP39151.1 TetR/AcrR family transcriptional regulator [Chitinophagales bacterium]
MISASRKAHIRNSAQKLFQEKGYAATSMRDLAKEVGVEAPSLYNHFSSKNELLKEICFDIASQFFTSFKTATENQNTYSEKLSAAIKAHLLIVYGNIDASTVFFEEWSFLEGADLAKFKKLRIFYQQQFKTLVEKGIEAKEFKNIDVNLTAFTILSTLNATRELFKKNSFEKVTEHCIKILLNGIKH